MRTARFVGDIGGWTKAFRFDCKRKTNDFSRTYRPRTFESVVHDVEGFGVKSAIKAFATQRLRGSLPLRESLRRGAPSPLELIISSSPIICVLSSVCPEVNPASSPIGPCASHASTCSTIARRAATTVA